LSIPGFFDIANACQAAKFEVLTAVLLNIEDFLGVVPNDW
jgi:hypothetical protein